MSINNPIPPKVYRNMLSNNYKQAQKDYQKILEFQKNVYNPICQKEDRYIPQKTRGNVLTQEYFKKMMEKPEKAHIKRIPIQSNLTSGAIVITEPNKNIGKKVRQNQFHHASSAQKRNLGKKIVSENYKKFYYDDFYSTKLNQTEIKTNNKKEVKRHQLMDHVDLLKFAPKKLNQEKTQKYQAKNVDTKDRIFPNVNKEDKNKYTIRKIYKNNIDHLNENNSDNKNQIKKLETKPCNTDFKKVSAEARNNLNKRYYFENTKPFW